MRLSPSAWKRSRKGTSSLTKKDYYPTVSALIQHKAKKKLSVAQMETLAIIAYKQPITKSEIEHIRGVSCDYAIQKLLEKELVAISGKSEGPGRPIMYSTSDSFMDYFGIKSVKDLPQLKDLHLEQNEIGQPSELMEAEPETEATAQDSEVTAMSEAGSETPVLSETLNEEGDTIEAPLMGSEDYSAPVMLSEEAEELNEAVPPAAGEAEDLELPDRKQIFLENQPGAPESEAADEKRPSGTKASNSDRSIRDVGRATRCEGLVSCILPTAFRPRCPPWFFTWQLPQSK